MRRRARVGLQELVIGRDNLARRFEASTLAKERADVVLLGNRSRNPPAGTGSGFGGLGTWVDAETPSGTIDGVNATFTLAAAPSPASSLQLYLNGVRQIAGTHFILAGSTITYQAGYIPQTGDQHRADYRAGGATLVEAETPAGTINGSNPTFTLANSPSPAGSLRLYLNGVRLLLTTHYTLVGSTITYQAGMIPQTGDQHVADYRY